MTALTEKFLSKPSLVKISKRSAIYLLPLLIGVLVFWLSESRFDFVQTQISLEHSQRKAKTIKVESIESSPAAVFKVKTNGIDLDPFNVMRLAAALQPTSALDPALRVDAKRKREPLEAFPIDVIQMVGTMKQDGKISAMVKAENQVFLVKPGMYLGTNSGKITKIDDKSISYVELAQDSSGEWKSRGGLLEITDLTSNTKSASK